MYTHIYIYTHPGTLNPSSSHLIPSLLTVDIASVTYFLGDTLIVFIKWFMVTNILPRIRHCVAA